MRLMSMIGATALLLALGACSGGADAGNSMTASSMPNATDAPANAAMVQPLPAAASNEYPPCSAPVKDHCVQK